MDTWILRLSQVDLPDQPILVKVLRKAGGQKLDLDLLATDGESAYRTKIREKKLDKLRDADYDGSAEDWQNYLLYAFVSRTEHPLPPVLSENLEVICRFTGRGSKRRLAIYLQITVDGINSKRGSVELTFDDNTDDVNLFEWASQVIEDRDRLQHELERSKKSVADIEGTIASLHAQLKDLVKAKEDHEAQMLSKFALLLNEKKLRIRVLQRQIAEQGQPSKGTSRTKSTNTSRKRKQMASDVSPDLDSDSDGFEPMQIDGAADVEVDQNQDSDSEQERRTESASGSDAGLDIPSPATGKNARSAEAQAMEANDSVNIQADADSETASEDDEL